MGDFTGVQCEQRIRVIRGYIYTCGRSRGIDIDAAWYSHAGYVVTLVHGTPHIRSRFSRAAKARHAVRATSEDGVPAKDPHIREDLDEVMTRHCMDTLTKNIKLHDGIRDMQSGNRLSKEGAKLAREAPDLVMR